MRHQRTYSNHKVIISKDFFHGGDGDGGKIEWVHGFQLHAFVEAFRPFRRRVCRRIRRVCRNVRKYAVGGVDGVVAEDFEHVRR